MPHNNKDTGTQPSASLPAYSEQWNTDTHSDTESINPLVLWVWSTGQTLSMCMNVGASDVGTYWQSSHREPPFQVLQGELQGLKERENHCDFFFFLTSFSNHCYTKCAAWALGSKWTAKQTKYKKNKKTPWTCKKRPLSVKSRQSPSRHAASGSVASSLQRCSTAKTLGRVVVLPERQSRIFSKLHYGLF